MPSELPSKYNSKEAEAKWYEKWEKSEFFKPQIDPAKKPYTIVIPPPNVTGILHMGHALNNTIQDILTRWQRMKQVPALWVPGVDHAGIATQNVVEKKLAKEGKTRHQLGREKFVEAVWKWKEEYGSTIVRQLRRLGASCDWSRERFTMDEGLSRAVRECFVGLYEKGLIYRGDYIINWCPRCQTALSDEEAVHKEVEGALYHINYKIEGSNDHITLATTRPETMLGDTAVAINPKDERYKHLHGKKVILPLINRTIPVIEDDFVDPDFGTGIVKVTPAHDPNDFQMGIRHKLERINVMNPDGTINEHGGLYKGLDRFEARKRIVHDLEAKELFVKRVSHGHSVGHCYRCETVVEPYLSKQWFVKMKPLAERALNAHQKGEVKFYPERWNKVYTSWLENIRDWCISRQIWWGHQIPVWYCNQCPDGQGIIVTRTDPSRCPACGNKDLKRDPDVLDTWFSSWLWPFSTLGWPEKTKDLDYFYPTSTLVTAQEIIFFWVARMIMAGLQFKDSVPFNKVFIHGTVRVEGGQKMSKSLGNSIDPLEIIDEMGADALRFSLMMLAATDVYLTRQKFEMGRNFTNKIWNAFKFVLGNLGESIVLRRRDAKVSDAEISSLESIDKWILAELDDTIKQVDQYLEQFKFYDASNAIYHFFWHSFCDWYLELAKPALFEKGERSKTVQFVLFSVLEKSMRLLHPFMPFLTEEIWQLMKSHFKSLSEFMPVFNQESIMLSEWPRVEYGNRFEKEASEIKLFQEAVAGIRDLRTRLGLKPNDELEEASIVLTSQKESSALNQFAPQIERFCKVKKVTFKKEKMKGSGVASRVFSNMEIFISGLSLEGLKAEEERTKKKITEIEGVLRSLQGRLKDSKFVSNAPEEVIEKEKEREQDLTSQLAAYRENLNLFSQK